MSAGWRSALIARRCGSSCDSVRATCVLSAQARYALLRQGNVRHLPPLHVLAIASSHSRPNVGYSSSCYSFSRAPSCIPYRCLRPALCLSRSIFIQALLTASPHWLQARMDREAAAMQDQNRAELDESKKEVQARLLETDQALQVALGSAGALSWKGATMN